MRRALTMLLCAYLLLWVPIGLANEIFATLPSLGMRGAPALAELAVHAAAAVLAAAAGWMLLVYAPAAQQIAQVAVAAQAALAVQSLHWTVLPRQTAPGARLPLTVLAIAHALFWVAVLRRTRMDRDLPERHGPR